MAAPINNSNSHIPLTNKNTDIEDLYAIGRKIGSVYELIIREYSTSIEEAQKAIGGNFVGQHEPPTPITKYIERLIKYKYCLGIDEIYPTRKDRADACKVILLYAAFYVDRLRERIFEAHKIEILTPLTVHRFFVAALILANKYLNDFSTVNEDVARLAGISNKELNDLEVEFLFLIKFDLFIPLKDYKTFAEVIKNSIPKAMEVSTNRSPEDLISEEYSADSQSSSSSSSPTEDPNDYPA